MPWLNVVGIDEHFFRKTPPSASANLFLFWSTTKAAE
jgi:hypothetical protein